jgi:hypothetical protein
MFIKASGSATLIIMESFFIYHTTYICAWNGIWNFPVVCLWNLFDLDCMSDSLLHSKVIVRFDDRATVFLLLKSQK